MSRVVKGLIVIALIIAVAIIFCGSKQKSNFDSDVCAGHCFRDGNGKIMDIYDCCECRATVTNQFEPNFHECMCSEGYKDYCYRPVTNLLLSQ